MLFDQELNLTLLFIMSFHVPKIIVILCIKKCGKINTLAFPHRNALTSIQWQKFHLFIFGVFLYGRSQRARTSYAPQGWEGTVGHHNYTSKEPFLQY